MWLVWYLCQSSLSEFKLSHLFKACFFSSHLSLALPSCHEPFHLGHGIHEVQLRPFFLRIILKVLGISEQAEHAVKPIDPVVLFQFYEDSFQVSLAADIAGVELAVLGLLGLIESGL